MRKIKKNYLALIVGLICFIIPFFWFKNGEVDYGGDSTRLYFYDPLSWLKNIALFYVNPLESLGAEHANFSLVPFLSFLALLKIILNNSSYLLNNFFNGLLLSGTFLTLNLLILEFLKNEKSDEKKIVAGIGSLFFVFSPLLIYDWERALYSQYQILAYPLFALFFLKYLNSGKKKYLFLLPFVTFLFAVNFSFWSAPWFFAFFSFFFLFLFFISFHQGKLIRFFKGLAIVVGLFLLVNSFEIFSQSLNLFGLSGTNYKSYFGESSASRGIPYFMSIQPHTRLTYSFFNQPQYVITHGYNHPQEENIYSYGIKNLFLFGIYPILICLAIIFRKKGANQEFDKINVLVLLFFLLSLFFVTANITDIGQNIYKNLFYIPGFSMFRSYYTKFSLIFVFFFSVLISFSIFRLLNNLKGRAVKTFMIAIVLVLVIYNGWPLISGRIVNTTLYNSGNLKIPIKLDPAYEEFVKEIKLNSSDGRIMSFPLTNESYQLLRGENNGVYFGTSSLSILTGKSDFTGLGSFGPFRSQVEKLIENRNYNNLQKMLGLLNIGFFFHNTDNFIYDNFPDYPYSGWLKSMFPNQSSISTFISKLLPEKILSVKDFVFYKNLVGFLPQFYVSKDRVYSTNESERLSSELDFSDSDPRVAYYFCPLGAIGCPEVENINNFFVTGKSDSSVEDTFFDNSYFGFGKEVIYPAVKNKSDFLWWLTLINEYRQQYPVFFDKEKFIEKKLFFSNKRIKEELSFRKGSGKQIAVYKKLVEGAIDNLKLLSDENKRKVVAMEIRDNLWSNLEYIRYSELINRKIWEGEIASLIEKNRKFVPEFNLFDRKYSFSLPKSGKYELFYRFSNVQENQQKKLLNSMAIEVGGVEIKAESKRSSYGDWFEAGELNLSDGEQILKLKFNDLPDYLADEKWQNRQPLVKEELSVFNKYSKFFVPENYFYKKINNWQPNSWYAIVWDKTQAGVGLSIREEYEDNGPKSRILREIPQETKESKIVFYFKSHAGAISGEVLVYGRPLESDGNFTINRLNINLVPVFEPEIVLRHKNDQIDNSPLPKITFFKINPTKYKVKIEKALYPYTLVFLNSYHSGWKIFLDHSFFAKSNLGEQKVYFQGEISEAKDMNNFFDKYVFETWEKKPVADDKHYLVNGYANSWYISPIDVGNETDYQLTVEFVPQRLLYISLTISLLTLFLLFSFLVKMILHKKSI